MAAVIEVAIGPGNVAGEFRVEVIVVPHPAGSSQCAGTSAAGGHKG
jgi:hypothetical protein